MWLACGGNSEAFGYMGQLVQSGMKLCGNLWLCGLSLEIRCEAVWVVSDLMRQSTMWAVS